MNKPGLRAAIFIPLRDATQSVLLECKPYLLRAFYERLKDNVESVVVAVDARVCPREIRVVVARLARLPRVASRNARVPPRQRPARVLGDQYVVVASMSLCPNHTSVNIQLPVHTT